MRATPLEASIAGVEVHAQALEQLLQGASLSRPDYAFGLELLLAVVASGLLAVVLSWSGALLAALCGGTFLLGLVLLSWLAFQKGGVLIDPVFPVVAAALTYAAATAVAYFRTERERNFVRQAFSHYLAPDLVQRLTREPWRLQLGGETRDMTILFSDVQGFTRIAESYRDNPRGLTRLMNQLLSPLTTEIMARNGTVDKYIGDAIMAFWNAPLDDRDHARNACEAAFQMSERLAELNASRRQEALQAHEDGEPLKLRIGLATGPGVVGNMGSDVRFDYSVLGDTVNLASRLEGLCSEYGVGILISDEARELGSESLAVIEVDTVRVRGRDRAERIWAIVGDQDMAACAPFNALREGVAAALVSYRKKEWRQPKNSFWYSRILPATSAYQV